MVEGSPTTFNDKLPTLVVDPRPEAVEVPIVSFDGTDGRGLIPCLGDFSSAHPWTVEWYAKIKSPPVLSNYFILSTAVNARGAVLLNAPYFAVRKTVIEGSTIVPGTVPYDIINRWATVRFSYDGAGLVSIYVDDAPTPFDTISVVCGLTPENFMSQSASNFLSSDVAYLKVTGTYSIGGDEVDWDYGFEEGLGDTVYNRSSNQCHMTLSGTLNGWERTVSDERSSDNLRNGFRLAVGVQIPALLSDPTTAADGNPVTNQGTDYSKYVLNGATVSLIQKDLANGDLLQRFIFSGDGIAFDAVTMAVFEAFVSGTDMVWIKWHPTLCRIKEICVYRIDLVLTEPQHNQFVNYFTQGTCGGGVVPFSNLDFSDPDNSHWFL
jgi:hypothetical protein